MSSLEEFVRQNCCQFQTENLQKYATFIFHKSNLKSTVFTPKEILEILNYNNLIMIIHKLSCKDIYL